jgi:hypothetical protein
MCGDFMGSIWIKRKKNMRRSSRRGVKESKAKAKAYIDYLAAPDHKVLTGMLPPPREANISKITFNRARDRLKPGKRIPLALQRGKRHAVVGSVHSGPASRHILFMNVGDAPVLGAVQWLNSGGQRPPWTTNVEGLSAQRMTLFLTEGGTRRPFALRAEKRNAVKRLYFDPKEPSTIQPITDKLRHKFCNISRSNVRGVLKSLETYQLMRPRRKMPAIQHHTLYTKPGVIAMDSFFPSEKSGWLKRNVLVCMDVWSRFSRAYAVERREQRFYKVAMTAFFKELMSLGVMPRRLLTDKGSELHVGTPLMEKFRLPRDGQKPLHLRSVTGTPVQAVENLNAQYQRRLEPYRIADIHDDVAPLLWDISEQLNNQRRPKRGNHTPYELLQMGDTQRREVNRVYDESYHGIGVEAQKKLPLLKNGDHVRKLEMTFKDQASGKLKGFQEKWSRRIYQVLGKTALNRNKHVYRFRIGDPKRTYFRHELLLVPKDVDSEILVFPTSGSHLVQDMYKPP